MPSNSFIKFCAIGLVIGFVLWCGITFGPLVAVLVTGAIILTTVIVEYFRNSYVSLNEMEVGVVFNKKGNFVCFLDNDYGRIEQGKPRPRKRTTPLTRHSINPYEEKMTSIIHKGSQKAEGTIDKVRTLEGIPIKIKWAVSFKIITTDIKEGLEFKMARGLPANASNMVAGKASQALTHLIETKSIHALYRISDGSVGSGSLQQLEDELREKVRQSTAIFGAEIGNNDVKVGPIELPEGFETALQNMFQKELQTETLVAGLSQIRKAISEYADDDIKRLTELVRLRILDEQSEPLLVTESFIDLNHAKEISKNGRSQKANNRNGNHSD